MQSISSDKAPAIPMIDALRGVAILGVIMVHTREGFRGLHWLTDAIASQGGWGVQLFFILSALTLLLSWHGRKEAAATGRFLIRRFFRVAPMFYCAIALYAVLDGFSRRPYAPRGVGLSEYLQTIFFVHGWTPTSINSIVPGGWSIGDEVGFYLLFPALVILLSSLRRSLVAFGLFTALGAVLAFLVWQVSGFQSIELRGAYLLKGFLLWWLPSQLPVFVIGFMVYFLAFRPPAGRQWSEATRLTVGRALIGLSVAAALGLALLPLRSFAYFPYAIVFGALVWGLLLAPVKLVTHPIMLHIGKVSYSAYFVHFLVVRFSPGFARTLLPQPDLSWLLYFVLITAVTVAISTLTHAWIEQPGIRLGRKLAARLGASPAPLAAPATDARAS